MFPEWQVEYQERIQYFLLGGGGGGAQIWVGKGDPNFGSERAVELWDLV